MSENSDKFESIRSKGEMYFKTLTMVYCPYFKDHVHFNAEGLEHLKFKRRNVARPKEDQYMRFKLLKLIPVILENSKTVQGIWETNEFQKVRKYGKNMSVLLPVMYYEFIAVIEFSRVKIIIKRVKDGLYIFWSIIPSWGINPGGTKRKLHTGNLYED